MDDARHPAFTSQLLAPLVAEGRLTYAFTHKPLPVGGACPTDNTTPLTPEQCHANRTWWAKQAGCQLPQTQTWAVPTQTHGVQWVATSALSSLAPQQRQAALQGVDAIIIDTVGDIALIQVADCVPVIIVDTTTNVAAIIHAGWRGTAAGITPKVVSALCEQWGCQPERLAVVIGSAIGQCDYEVSPEVAEALLASLPPACVAEAKATCVALSPTTGKPHVDVKGFNAHQVLSMGVEMVEVLTPSTYADTACLWSHRRGDKQRQGVLLQWLAS
jgi:YfiH family protein